MREPFVLVSPEDGTFAGHAAASWSDLEGVPLIRISAHTGNRMLIDDALGQPARDPELALRGAACEHGNRSGSGPRASPRLAT
jgi:LysR substrate binding domain